MNYKYFTIYENGKLTAELLKNLWRKVCVKVHPDKGGTHEEYLEAQTEYQSLLERVNAGFTATSDSPESFDSFIDFLAGISPVVRDCIRAVVAVTGIGVVEITGYWVWVALDKSQIDERTALKEINIDGKRFTWRRDHQRWVWRGVQAKGRGMSWEQKKEYWGYSRYSKNPNGELAEN